ENFLVSERQKVKRYQQHYSNDYFWRTYAQQEIDYLEEADGVILAYEFKWNPRKRPRFPKNFLAAYPNAKTQIISRDNYLPFVLGERNIEAI
ncbi:MAG: DUF4143 domain-containing protein, partial [Bacteroidota bacterium]